MNDNVLAVPADVELLQQPHLDKRVGELGKRAVGDAETVRNAGHILH